MRNQAKVGLLALGIVLAASAEAQRPISGVGGVAVGVSLASSAVDGPLKVALVPFENRSGAALPDLGRQAKEVLENFVVGLQDVQVVTRDRLLELQEESKLREFLDGTSPGAHLIGADFVLTGVVLSYDVDRRDFEFYGTKNVKDQYRMGLKISLLDAATGQVAFAEGFEAQYSDRYAEGAVPSEPVSRTLELLRDALRQAADGLRENIYAKRGSRAVTAASG